MTDKELFPTFKEFSKTVAAVRCETFRNKVITS